MISTEGPATQKRVDIVGREDSIDLSSIGGRIAFTRLRKKLTQSDLGKAIGKARATIVQYESNGIQPPLDVVEALAQRLSTSPEYLAFGRHGVDGADRREAIVTVPEMKLGRNGEFSQAVFALPKTMLNDFGIGDDSHRDIKVYVVQDDCPQFSIPAHARLLVDTEDKSLSSSRNLYLLNTPSGLEIVRPEPQLIAATKMRVTGSTGQVFEVSLKELNVIGRVVGKFTNV